MSNSFVTPWTVGCQDPPSTGFPRQEYWSGLPFPSPGDLSDPGIKPVSLCIAGRFFTTEPPGKPCMYVLVYVHMGVCVCVCVCVWRERKKKKNLISENSKKICWKKITSIGFLSKAQKVFLFFKKLKPLLQRYETS